MQSILSQYPSIFLHTGDCYLGVRPTVVSTVLGSCVAVTLFSPQRSLGCICHAFLPDSREHRSRDEPQVCRFVDTALANMLESMGKLGIAPGSLEVKVFGGASGYASGLDVESAFNIGPRNVAAVHHHLAGKGLAPAVSEVGGSRGRKLFFLTSTGEVWIKRLGRIGPEAMGVAPRRCPATPRGKGRNAT